MLAPGEIGSVHARVLVVKLEVRPVGVERMRVPAVTLPLDALRVVLKRAVARQDTRVRVVRCLGAVVAGHDRLPALLHEEHAGLDHVSTLTIMLLLLPDDDSDRRADDDYHEHGEDGGGRILLDNIDHAGRAVDLLDRSQILGVLLHADMHLIILVVEHRVEVLQEGQAESERVSVANALNRQLALAVEVDHVAARLDDHLAAACLDR